LHGCQNILTPGNEQNPNREIKKEEKALPGCQNILTPGRRTKTEPGNNERGKSSTRLPKHFNARQTEKSGREKCPCT